MLSGLKNLSGKVVVITGASSGLGEACAHAFYCAGCRVILCARRIGELQRVKAELEGLQLKIPAPEVRIVPFDLADLPGIAAAMEQVRACHGRVDIVINNGGISYRGAVADTSIDVDSAVMNVNYFGTIAVTKALLPHMLEQHSGHLVAISSIQGKLALPFRSAYGASKHAVQSFFDSLRAEIAHQGIHVTVISPGYIRTNLSLNALSADGTTYGKMDETISTGMSTEYVARQILRAVAIEQSELLIGPFTHRLATYLRNFLPDVFCHIMAKRALRHSEQERKQL
jgi:dehydrogenase/reductase SDR family protein 7B